MAPDIASPHYNGLDPPRRYWAIVAMILTLAMSVIDASIANVALPTIAGDLDAEPAFAIWIVNAYQIAILVSILPLAALGDMFGYSRIYLGGMIVFTVASLASALSDSMTMLLMARILQGLGASGIMSVNMAVVRYIYPLEWIGRGIGLNAVVIAVCAAAGPTISSIILSVAPWPWLFAVNVPIGLFAIGIGLSSLPPSVRVRRPFDYLSALLNALTFGFLIVLIETFGRNPSPLLIAVEVAVILGCGYTLFRRQVSASSPLVPLDLLRIPMFALSIGTSFCSFVAQTLALVSLPFFLQVNLGHTPVETGLLMTPWPLATTVMAPISGRLSDRYPAGMFGAIGLLIFALGLAALALTPDGAATWDIAWRMALAGAGFGFYQSPNNRQIILSAPRERSGGAAGMQGMARLVGQTVGAAFAALLFALLAYDRATVLASWLGVVFALAGAGVSALRLTDLTRNNAP